eukprot:CAMPEP_0113888850 /NCGR_PEP_ID=MMETSP0780_2-20120614/13123_1 /TAXON_ID=652834 /ORGANISM="Palpitomonas bilix" /LENGTH=1167 /DNA_ID=CAMNT_0000877789 /DNA_START=21 /DNA_END=3524 /DNA_ORIENTATION=- /assembly_acc=CAM_ASM_000599
MYLYSVTLQKAGGIQKAVYGSFSAPKVQEIVVSRGKSLEVFTTDGEGRLISLYYTEVFGTILSLSTFRLTGGNRDYIIVGSDSGKITILMYEREKATFVKIHQETFGKSGSRRIVPGSYLTCDPRGRAVLISAIEKQKFVYVLNRDGAANLTISSPLEAHKSHTITFDVVGMDVDYENPCFACLELDYSEVDEDATGEAAASVEKQITYYELDLGLNHVVRKATLAVERSAHALYAVPGGGDGPGGVLVCSEGLISYMNINHDAVAAPIPRREQVGDASLRPPVIVTGALHKQKKMFFFLLQTDVGDLMKVTLDYEKNKVSRVKIAYFDTVPIASSICVLRSGYLFVAAEFSNHCLFQFRSIGEDEMDLSRAREVKDLGTVVPFYSPRPWENISLADEIESLSPVTKMELTDVQGGSGKGLICLCGRGARSSIRVLQYGMGITEMAVSDMPGNPSSVWTVKTSARAEHDDYIVVSFVGATLVLSIGERVEEVTDSGLLLSSSTLAVGRLGDDALVQVHPHGIRHVRSDRRINDWKAPGRQQVSHASLTSTQVVLCMTGGDVLYFELDVSGQLLEVERVEGLGEVQALSLSPVDEGRKRAKFMAVAVGSIVRVLSLDPQNTMETVASQGLSENAQSLCFLPAGGLMYLYIGLGSGILIRSTIDKITGALSDNRTRLIGARGIRLRELRLNGESAFAALSSKTWVGYSYQRRVQLAPLAYTPVEDVSSFSSPDCPEGIVAVAGNTLRILSIDRLGEVLHQTAFPLDYTPRSFVRISGTSLIAIIEADHNAIASTVTDTDEMPKSVFGVVPGGKGKWGSRIRVMDLDKGVTVQCFALANNEAAVSLCISAFADRPGEQFLVVGAASDMVLQPRSCSSGFLYLYRINGSQGIEIVHKTAIDGIPSALASFKGRLLVGVGKLLRIYDGGKKKLLKKSENKFFPNLITSISVRGERIYVSDVAEAFHLVRYKKSDNALVIFADCTHPRWTTSSTLLDYDSIGAVDKFGNFFVSRLDAKLSEELDEDPTGARIKWEYGTLNGAQYKMDDVINFHMGETSCALVRGSLQAGGDEAIITAGVMGTIGAFIPFLTASDYKLFQSLEMHMRQENPPLLGRDHLAYRSSYFPVKGTIDGDMVETFLSLSPERQRDIADSLDRSVSELQKKIEDMRNRIL